MVAIRKTDSGARLYVFLFANVPPTETYPAMTDLEGLDPSPCHPDDRLFEWPIQGDGLWDGSLRAYSDRVVVAQYTEGGYGRCGVVSYSNGLHRCKAIGT